MPSQTIKWLLSGSTGRAVGNHMWALRWVTLLWHGLAVQFALGPYLRENILDT